MSTTKILGWLLLISGILIIVFSLFSSWNIFAGNSLPPQLFQGTKTIAVSSQERSGDLVAEAERVLQEQIQKQLQGIIPADSIPQLLNLLSWSILAGILIFGGAQISNLGIRLLKK